MMVKYRVGAAKNRQCECIIGGITIDCHVDNASDYPVINWLNQLNKLVIEGYFFFLLRYIGQHDLSPTTKITIRYKLSTYS